MLKLFQSNDLILSGWPRISWNVEQVEGLHRQMRYRLATKILTEIYRQPTILNNSSTPFLLYSSYLLSTPSHPVHAPHPLLKGVDSTSYGWSGTTLI